LVLAGGLPSNHLIELQGNARAVGLDNNELIFTKRLSDEEFVYLYKCCKLYVFPSWHEGFGLPVLEAMKCGAPVICSNTSSLPELIDFEDAMFDPYDVTAITQKMEHALTDDSFRDQLSLLGVARAKLFSWDETAKRAIFAWENIPFINSTKLLDLNLEGIRLFSDLAAHIKPQDKKNMMSISACLALNQQVNNKRQLLVDISELVQKDAKTGIQRVVRNILYKWLTDPPPGFSVEPVYATQEFGYRYARVFTQNFMSCPKTNVVDEPIDYAVGDVFLGLDFQPQIQSRQNPFYQHLRQHGVNVFFVIYDLLCIRMPENFVFGAEEGFTQWLEVVAEVDGAICISAAVAKELEEWLINRKINRLRSFELNWFHLGADIDKPNQSKGFPEYFEAVLNQLSIYPSFLMVGTLEPRKAHAQVLDAFELLWENGADVNLVVVGKKGWLADELIKRLHRHQETNKHLFWFDGASDEQLEILYAANTCLIAASYGEGFGLPVIEAAQRKLPVIARDIPVFREVAGDHAYYFKADHPGELAKAIENWLGLFKSNQHPKSDNMPFITWTESATQLLKAMGLSNEEKSNYNEVKVTP
jgi:glycosyltransferase involved in cell wall biosynthesis